MHFCWSTVRMWPSFERNWILVISVFMVYFSIVECLSCVQCSSLENPECIAGNIAPTPCTLANSTYCIKYEGEVKDVNIKLVVRECSNQNEPSQCKTKTIGHHDKPVNVCFYSCTTDGCNGNSASSFTSSYVNVLLSFLMGFTAFSMTLPYGVTAL